MKIALFGGSFDPPHAGHDASVKAILSSLKPDLLVIMPSFLNPFKKSFSAAPQLRLRWCRALWGDTPHVEVSDYEISQNHPVSTIQSVKFLLEKYGRNGKIAAETAAETNKILQGGTADQISVGSESETGRISQSKVGKIPRDGISEAGGAADVGEARSADKISNAVASAIPLTVTNKVLNSAGGEIPSATENGISDVVKIPCAAPSEISNASEILSSAVDENPSTDGISSAAWGEILNSDEISGVKISTAFASKILGAGEIISSDISGAVKDANDVSGASDKNGASNANGANTANGAGSANKASNAGGVDALSKLYIVVGADNLSELHKWRDFSELQKLAEFVVLTRPGYEIPRQWADLRRIEIAVDASSSGFRRDFKGEIPPKIAAEVIKFYKRKDMQDPKQRAERIAEILNEKKAEDVQIIDMSEREYIAKLVVIATTLTSRHAASLIEELKSVLKPLGEEFLAIESGDEWSVVDLGDIIVHLISEAYRAKYNIEDFLDKLKKEQF